jgi:hypothetical protein
VNSAQKEQCLHQGRSENEYSTGEVATEEAEDAEEAEEAKNPKIKDCQKKSFDVSKIV